MFVMQGVSPEAQEEMRRNMGLHLPLHRQYIEYLGQLLTGSLGQSFHYREPVWEILTEKFWNTIFLMGGSLILAYLFGIVFGALMGWYRGSTFEKGGIVVTLVARSSPQFLTGIVLLTVFVFHLDWFPYGGMRSIGSGQASGIDKFLTWDFVHHLALPMVTGAIYFMATPALLMRNTMLDVLDADFIEIKEAIGVPPHKVMFKHAARNSVLPLVTMMAIVTGMAIGGSVVIETVFNWPGMGREMVDSVQRNDYPVAMGAFFLMGSVIIFMNFVADLAYVYLDPRVTYD
jgi:peptide/nickel transport system permease protein